VLDHEASKQLRDELLGEIRRLKDGEDLALWAYRRLSAKNTLTADDARIVEGAYQAILDAPESAAVDEPTGPIPTTSTPSAAEASKAVQSSAKVNDPRSMEVSTHNVMLLRKPIRQRNKTHLTFVASQPCLVCQRLPSDAHHLKFAQPRTLGRKVSDEFTVPLCRDHHLQLHHHGNEAAWWANLKIAPMETAKDLWAVTFREHSSIAASNP
jgi:hypothetical protein